MRRALACYDEFLRKTIAEHAGTVSPTTGDGMPALEGHQLWSPCVGNSALPPPRSPDSARPKCSLCVLISPGRNSGVSTMLSTSKGRRIAWRPAVQGKSPPGHLRVWELEPLGPSRTLATHTYDWTELTDRSRIPPAQATRPVKLRASLDRLAAMAEKPKSQQG